MGAQNITEVGKMWIETAKVLRRAMDRLKRRGLVTKDAAFFMELNWTEYEGANKLGCQPRTPLTWGDFLQVMTLIRQKSKDVYLDTVRNLLMDDTLVLDESFVNDN